jgi:hypothetical protein
MAPTETTQAESVETTQDMTSSSLQVDALSMPPSESMRTESYEHSASVEINSDMTSPSPTIGRSNTALNDIISTKTQETIHSTEALRHIVQSYVELDRSSAVTNEMALPRAAELAVSNETIIDLALMNSDLDALIEVSDFSNNKLLEIQEQSVSARSTPDNDASRVATEEQNMAYGLVETTLTETLKLPFNPFTVEDTQESTPPSPVAEASSTGDICKPMEISSPEEDYQAASEEDDRNTTFHFSNACGADAHSEFPETNSTETQEHAATGADKASPSLAPDNSNVVPDLFEMASPYIQERSALAEVMPDVDCLLPSADDLRKGSEFVETSSTEISKLCHSSKDTSDKSLPSSSPTASAMACNNHEMSSTEVREQSVLEDALDEQSFHSSIGGVNNHMDLSSRAQSKLQNLTSQLEAIQTQVLLPRLQLNLLGYAGAPKPSSSANPRWRIRQFPKAHPA